MSQWFQNTRQDFIAATLRQFGQIRRGDLTRQFDISAQQASLDIAAFMFSTPGIMEYDVRAKSYIFIEPNEANP